MTEAGKEAADSLQAAESPNNDIQKPDIQVVQMEWLECLNAAKNPMWIMNFAVGEVCYVWANHAAEVSHNKSLEEMRSQDLEADASEGAKKRHALFYDMIQRQGKVMGPTLQTIYPGGKPVTYELVMSPLRLVWKGVEQTVVFINGYEKRNQDIAVQHELKRAIEMQRHSKMLVMLFKCADGSMLAYSPSAYLFYQGYTFFASGGNFKDQSLANILRFSTPTDDSKFTVPELLEHVKNMSRTDTPIEIEVAKTPFENSKNVRWFRVTFVPISDPATGENSVSVTETDITNLKEVQYKLKQKEADQLDFFHHIVHELRTPLHGIINILERCMSRVRSKVKPDLNVVLSQSEQLLSLVNDIMDAATISRNGLRVAKERVDMNKVIERCVAIMRPQVIGQKKLINQATLRRRKSKRVFVTGDATRLQQVLTNLVGNAVKFTPQGEISVSMQDCDVEAADRGEDVDPEKKGMIMISVKDTGRGIAPDKIDNIFDNFNRGDEESVRSITGSGLGLGLCLKLVAAHGGAVYYVFIFLHACLLKTRLCLQFLRFAAPNNLRLRTLGKFYINSIPNKGSTFSFTVPRNDNKPSPQRPERSEGSWVRTSSTSVDDLSDRGVSSDRNSSGSDANNSNPRHRASASKLQQEIKRMKLKLLSAQDRIRRLEAAPAKTQSVASHDEGDTSPIMRKFSNLTVTSTVGMQSHSDRFGVIEILSVDDHPVNQMVVENIITSLDNYKVTSCMDGRSALDLLASRDYLPDLILLDVMMPGMSGYEVCTALRKLYNTSPLPVIMVSAKNREKEIVRGLESGANDYITKPFNRKELVARIGTQLRLKKVWRVELEAQRSNALLEELLPGHIIRRLKRGERLIADEHGEVTILFSDIVCFTELAAELETMEVVQLLNEVFTAFDEKTDEAGVYKVETIGDAYMVVAGHDESSNHDHAERIFRFAEHMLQAIKSVTIPGQREHYGKPHVQIRIGIHTGSAFSGVVGNKMPRYCFFGDTVNTASRMESNGFPMAVHVSETTYQKLKDSYQFHPHGESIIKGKGRMTTYLAKIGSWEQALKRRDSTFVPDQDSRSIRRASSLNSQTAISLDYIGEQKYANQRETDQISKQTSMLKQGLNSTSLSAEGFGLHQATQDVSREICRLPSSNSLVLESSSVSEVPVWKVENSEDIDSELSKNLNDVTQSVQLKTSFEIEHPNSATANASQSITRKSSLKVEEPADIVRLRPNNSLVTELKTQIQQLRQNIIDGAAVTNQLQMDDKSLQNEIENYRDKCAKLHLRNRELEHEQQQHHQQLNYMEQQVASLRKQLRDASEKLPLSQQTKSSQALVLSNKSKVEHHNLAIPLRVTQSAESTKLFTFLQDLGLDQYYHAFAREEISFELLPLLSNEQLKAIGIMSIGARLAIRNALGKLNTQRS